MKAIRILSGALVLALTAVATLWAEEVSKPAIEAFKTELTAINEFVKEHGVGLRENPLGGISMLRDLQVKLSAVNTTDLPVDLKEAYADFMRVMTKMTDSFKDWPAKAGEVLAFVQKKAREDAKFMEAFGATMVALNKEMTPILAKLDELGKKYGIENIGALRPK
jgi:hypothetical protein